MLFVNRIVTKYQVKGATRGEGLRGLRSPLARSKLRKKIKNFLFLADFVHTTRENVTTTLSYSPSYLILSHSSS